MQNEKADQYLFKGSPFDFDTILLQNGYKIIADRENDVIFEKEIKPLTEPDSNGVKPGTTDGKFKINIIRPTMLLKHGKYAVCSPYAVNYIFNVIPQLMIRRIQWDTFPGDHPDTLIAAVKQCESEAEAILTMFIEMDNKNLEAMRAYLAKQPESTNN